MLKRYQAFWSEPYDARGGAGDICAEADALPELVDAIVSAGHNYVDDVLDLVARDWLQAADMAALNVQISDAWREANPPVQGPKTKEQAQFEADTLAMMMFGETKSTAYLNEEFGPLTRGLSAIAS